MLKPSDSYSADVKMWLECGEHGRIDLSRITPTSVVARIYRDIPPCHADLVVTVDGQMLRSRVHIANGFSGSCVALALPVDHIAPF